MTLSMTNFANPVAVISILYLLGGRLGTLNVPAPVLTTSRSFWPVTTFVTTMVAPGIAPPFGSNTVPVIAPVAPACARRPAGVRSAIDNTPTKTAIHFVILTYPQNLDFAVSTLHTRDAIAQTC